MAEQVNSTTRQDLPEWARGAGVGGLQQLLQLIWNAPSDGKWYKPNADGSGEVLDVSGGMKKGGTPFDPSKPSGYDYQAIGNGQLPFAPLMSGYNDGELASRALAVDKLQSGQPLRLSADQWMADALGGAGGDLARMNQAYTLGGPIAGATRVGLMDALQGNSQDYAQQALLDSMFGGGANAATNSAYNQLKGEKDVARDASMFNFTGPNAGAARARAFDTIQGKYLSPESNPYLGANYDAAANRAAKAYRFATAPGIDAQFARAGSFGGSAHQQTKDMANFDFGQSLTDLANQMYGENYSRERQNMLNAGSEAQQYANTSLEAERSRQQATQQQLLQQQLQAALDERGGWRSMLDNTLSREANAADSELGRGVQTMSLFPQFMQSRYYDADVGRALFGEKRQMEDANNQIRYQNALSSYQLPFNLLNIFGSGLASMTGGGGVTTQTTTNPNAINPIAQGIGTGALTVGALSQLGTALGLGGGSAPAAAAAGG